jgi:hypothetical protein
MVTKASAPFADGHRGLAVVRWSVMGQPRYFAVWVVTPIRSGGTHSAEVLGAEVLGVGRVFVGPEGVGPEGVGPEFVGPVAVAWVPGSG